MHDDDIDAAVEAEVNRRVRLEDSKRGNTVIEWLCLIWALLALLFAFLNAGGFEFSNNESANRFAWWSIVCGAIAVAVIARFVFKNKPLHLVKARLPSFVSAVTSTIALFLGPTSEHIHRIAGLWTTGGDIYPSQHWPISADFATQITVIALLVISIMFAAWVLGVITSKWRVRFLVMWAVVVLVLCNMSFMLRLLFIFTIIGIFGAFGGAMPDIWKKREHQLIRQARQEFAERESQVLQEPPDELTD